ncbi:MAG: NAD(P)/FAD-dependent oxidoreductase [Pseudomonadota bacterium]
MTKEIMHTAASLESWTNSGRQPRIAIIGSGFSGIGALIKLKAEGFTDLTCFEKESDLGGTWRDNHYPGLSCDVPSHWYSYSFERNPDWNHRFSFGPDILKYIKFVAEKYDVRRYIKFNTRVDELTYRGATWELTTAKGDHAEYDIIVAATGVLVHPRLPEIEGRESFAGEMWHSARWRDDYPLEGKRVGIIGTGSTSCQIVGAIAETVDHLDVYQRTPQWLVPLPQSEYSAFWKTMLRYAPGLQMTLRRLFRWYGERTFGRATMGHQREQKAIQEQCEKHLAEAVSDPVLREKLTPSYKATCKRLIVCSTFYPALMRDNVDLVTTGIEKIVPEGIVLSDGELRPLDVMVMATGFYASNFILPTKVVGEGGVDLKAFWNGSPRAHRAVTVPGFPNFFMLEGPTSVFGNASLIELAEYQIDYMLSCLKEMKRRGAPAFSPKQEAFKAYNEELARGVVDTTWATGSCESWYLDASGTPNLYPFPPAQYRDEMRNPDFSEYHFS